MRWGGADGGRRGAATQTAARGTHSDPLPWPFSPPSPPAPPPRSLPLPLVQVPEDHADKAPFLASCLHPDLYQQYLQVTRALFSPPLSLAPVSPSHLTPHICPCNRVLVLVRSGCRQGRRRQRQVRALFVRMSVCVNGHLTTKHPPCHTETNAAAALPPKQARQPAPAPLPLPLALRLPGQGQRRRGARRPARCCASYSPAPAAAARAPGTRARSSRRRR